MLCLIVFCIIATHLHAQSYVKDNLCVDCFNSHLSDFTLIRFCARGECKLERERESLGSSVLTIMYYYIFDMAASERASVKKVRDDSLQYSQVWIFII